MARTGALKTNRVCRHPSFTGVSDHEIRAVVKLTSHTPASFPFAASARHVPSLSAHFAFHMFIASWGPMHRCFSTAPYDSQLACVEGIPGEGTQKGINIERVATTVTRNWSVVQSPDLRM